MRAVRGTPFEQALLASRWLHVVNDRLWSDFPRYWMAFNALYNAVAKDGEPEAMAVERVINFFFDPNAADECVKAIGDAAIAELTAVPPGDDRLSPRDPKYRKKTTDLATRIHGSGDSVERLAALMAIVYQVRCNLLHGSKDPAVMRDQELVTTCTPVMEIVVSRLAGIMQHHHELPDLRIARSRSATPII